MSIRLKGKQLAGINAAIKAGDSKLVNAEVQKAAQMAEGVATFDAAQGSVDRLKQYVVSAWIEAESVCVATTETGPADAMMVFKARDMLREVLGVLNTSPPNDQAHGREP